MAFEAPGQGVFWSIIRLLPLLSGGVAFATGARMNWIEYRVRLGDTLSGIAKRHGTTVEELVRVNDLMSENFLWVGQSIKIEGASALMPSPTSIATAAKTQRSAEEQPLKSSFKAATAFTPRHLREEPPARPSSSTVKFMGGDKSFKDFAKTFLSDWEYALPNEPRKGLTTSSVRALSASDSLGTHASKTMAVAPHLNNGIPHVGLLTQLKQSAEVLSFGRIQPDEGSYVYDTPDTTNGRKELYKRNTRVFVCRRLPGNWYFVRLDDGKFGYVSSERVWLNPPEPNAYLYKVKQSQGALAIAEQEFLNQARTRKGLKPIHWGMDWRHYTRVLVYANQGPRNGAGPPGIAYATKAQKWNETNTREGADIWVPSIEFAQRLKDELPSDSVTYTFTNG